ncbi:MAG: hypothetical protein OXH75_08125 [Acidobacteria bacterium]|nr:hypothetical protein [Acidobacteriota bacterium]
MNLIEMGMVVGVVAIGASTGYAVGEAGRATAQARADLAAATAVAELYRGMACASAAWTVRVDRIADRVDAAGLGVGRPTRAADAGGRLAREVPGGVARRGPRRWTTSAPASRCGSAGRCSSWNSHPLRTRSGG